GCACEDLVLASRQQLTQVRKSAQVPGRRASSCVVPAKAVAQILQGGDGGRGVVDEFGLVLLEHDQRLMRSDRVDRAPEHARLEALDVDLDEAQRSEIEVQAIDAFDADLDVAGTADASVGNRGAA